MSCRIITVAREYGSGGGSVASAMAEQLGWTLFDKAFITEAARAARVDPELARDCDERLDSWIHRVSKSALWSGAFEQVAISGDAVFFDADTMAALTAEIMRQAADQGNCVIVGRGAQCILRPRSDTFHVFVYAPLAKRVERLKRRLEKPEHLEELAATMDKIRSDYIRAHFGCNRKDPYLYDLMVNSEIGEDLAADIILRAAGLRSK